MARYENGSWGPQKSIEKVGENDSLPAIPSPEGREDLTLPTNPSSSHPPTPCNPAREIALPVTALGGARLPLDLKRSVAFHRKAAFWDQQSQGAG